MIFGTNVQKVYLGTQEVSKILIQNAEVFSTASTLLTAWSTVLNTYNINIVAAYDFRVRIGTTIDAIVGPNLVATGNVTFDSDGAVFTRVPSSYMESNTTIPVTYPFTMVYVGKVGVLGFPELVHIGVQPIKWTQTGETNVIIFSRTIQGILGYNGLDNSFIVYKPDNTEWYYLAISFFSNGTYRYQLRKASGNENGSQPALPTPTSFNGYIGIGAGLNSATSYNFNGNMRLALLLKQGFSTEQEMNDLYNIIASGPAQGILLT